jgi:PKD repeat protein/murein tripeptide amidase MpaA
MRNFTLGLFFTFISGLAFGQVLSPEMEFAQEKLNQREEFYFTFKCENHDLVREISRQLSIDKVQGNTVFAYANPQEFAEFLEYNLNFEPVYDYYNSPKALTMATTVAQMASWDRYPTHAVYLQMLDNFVTNYPALCKVETIGTSVDGYTMKCLVISDNIANDEDEPEFWWSGTMHGDETTGFIMELRFADYLLANYGTNTQVTNLVNNMEIYINPLANPDGTYYGSAGGLSVTNARRANSNNIDLNRNFPTANGDPYTIQPEIQAMMDYASYHDFVMSANTHGGIELMNYPWDTWQSWENINPDDTWWQYVSFVYRDEVALDAPATYFEGPGSMDYGPYNSTGVTHGADWYYAIGSRQDYMNYFQHIKEITIELSDTKLLGTENLNTYWGYNRDAMMLYTEQALYGFRGIVTDACSGSALSDVKVEIVGHDQDGSEVYSSAPIGNYHRPIIAGTWDVTFSKTGYTSKTLSVTVINDQSTRLDVELIPTGIAVPGFTASQTSIFVGESVNFTNTTTGTVTSRTWTFEGGTPATSTAVTPAAITYSTAGTFDVTLSVISSGCTVEEIKTDHIIVTIPGAPVAGFTSDETSTCTGIIQFTNSSVDASSYLWNFGDGQTSTEVNPLHAYTANGTFTVSLTATNPYGSDIYSVTDMITVDMPVSPTTTGASACGSATLTLSASGSGTLAWYDAATGGTEITTGTSYNTVFSNTTTLYVQSEVENLLSENVGPVDYSFGTAAALNSTTAHGLYFNAESDFTLVSVVVYSSTTGSKTINLKDDGGNIIQTANVTITNINTATTAMLNFAIPQGTGYQLAGTANNRLFRNSTGGSYPYEIDNVVSIYDNTADDLNYYYFFYNWVVEYNVPCVSARVPVTATINPVPSDVAVTGGGTQCGGSMTLNATGGTGGTIYWQNTTSNGTSTTTASSSQTISTSGTYYFRALAGASCWGNQGSATVTINPVPTAVTVSGGGTQCGGSMTLNATGGTGGTIYWQGTSSGGTSTTTASSSQSVSASGTYYFRSRSAAGCWGTEGSATVTINPLPSNVTVSGGGNQCGGSMTLNATGGTGGTIYWQNTTNNGTSTATASSSQSVSSSGTYYFRSQTSLGCWGAQGSAVVTINPAVTVSVSTTPESSPGANDGSATASASAGTSPYSLTWQNPYSGNPITGLAGGTYCVTVQDFNNCTASACGVVNTNGVAPIADFEADETSGCDILTVNFTDLSQNFPTSWAWDFGDGSSTSTEANPTHIYTVPGIYTVVLTVNNGVGSDVHTITNYIYFGETPEVSLSMTEETIAGNDGTVTADVVGGELPYTYQWNVVGSGAELTGLVAGEYCLTVTETYGCDNTACITVTNASVGFPPVANFEADDTEACGTLTVHFTDLSANSPTAWEWTFGDGSSTSSGTNPVHVYSEAGIYSVQLVVTNAFGGDQIYFGDYIVVFEKPVLTFEVTNESAEGMSDGSIELTITGGTEPYTINWSNGVHELINSGLPANIYSVAVIDDNGCMSTGIAEVEVMTAILEAGLSDLRVYPNPSSGIFKIESETMIHSIKIFDALGKLCFELVSSEKVIEISEDFLPGVYVMTIENGDGVNNMRLVIK